MTYGPDRIYGLDIETDNTNGFGLDPRNSSITELALATAEGGHVLTADTRADEFDGVLAPTQDALEALAPGLIATWNGSVFDMPFIDYRVTEHYGRGLVGPELVLDPQITPKYEPLPGYHGGYNVLWHTETGTHTHLDVSFAYKKFAEDNDIKWGLKPVCEALGIKMVELDRANLHQYTAAEREEYCLSDARGTRQLALRLLGLA